MTDSLTRRRLLAASGGLFAGLAGCLSDDDADDDSAFTADDSSTADDPSPMDDQSQDGVDGDDSGGSDDGGDDDPGGTEEESQDTGSEAADAIMSEVVEWDPSYAVDITFTGEQSGEVRLTVHEGDTHIVMDLGIEAEAYEVDGDKYEVMGGQCFIRENPEAEEQVPEVDGPRGDPPEIEVTETTTIEGESVYVFEMPDEAEAIWYVSTSTGYPVRFQTQAFTADFHSWGDTEPISPPDMDCQEV